MSNLISLYPGLSESYSLLLIRWPGYLDNTVAGGIPSGMSPFESLVKECMEEASLPDEIVRDSITATGAISYFFRFE